MLTNGTGTFSATLKTAPSQTITATDTANPSITGSSSSINVSAAAVSQLSITTPVNATVGIAFNFTVTAEDLFSNTATSYSGTVHFSSTDGQAVLPANSMLTNGTGTFSATPKTNGNQSITATDTAKTSITGISSSINVTSTQGSQLTITSGTPPSGTVGLTYGPSSTEYFSCVWSPIFGWHQYCTPCSSIPSGCASLKPCTGGVNIKPCRRAEQVDVGFILTANGGVGSYAWSWAAATNSSLPPGLNLSKGFISGTPTSPRPYSVVVTLTDSGPPTLQVSASYTITIASPPPPVINAVLRLPIGTLNSPYVGFTFTANSGGPPLTWSEAGALPQGMLLSPDGELSGKPSASGTYPITLMVQDSYGQEGSPEPVAIQVLTQGFLPTGKMESSRAGHTATLLNTGKVLITGGASIGASSLLATAELFDPTSRTFSATGNMGMARVSHTATLLKDGRVLVIGGMDTTDNPTSTAEIFDPVSGSFSPTGSMEAARSGNTATLLNNGKVLVTGGLDTSGNFLATAELFDPDDRNLFVDGQHGDTTSRTHGNISQRRQGISGRGRYYYSRDFRSRHWDLHADRQHGSSTYGPHRDVTQQWKSARDRRTRQRQQFPLDSRTI